VDWIKSGWCTVAGFCESADHVEVGEVGETRGVVKLKVKLFLCF
jgi:hypothetical protein